MQLQFPTRDALPSLQQLPILAADIGFGAAKSFGVAANRPGSADPPTCFNFGDGVRAVAEFVTAHWESVLIVEAPLSGLFDQTGNPRPRPFERRKEDGKSQTRAWYMQAGAAVALGALMLFRELQLQVSHPRTLHVLEGFVTFKCTKSPHEADAAALIRAFTSGSSDSILDLSAGEGERAVNLLTLAGLMAPDAECPLIVIATV